MSILVEIIDWLQDKPTFWQEATYRIIHRNHFDEDDISDLIRICKTEVGLIKSRIIPPNLNKLQHSIRISESFNKTISLSKIFDIQNINAIRDGSELTFSQHGLTVIYGDNGSGKSSYVSILKQVCNTRGDFPVISGSLFKTNNNKTDQLAKVEYIIEGRDSQIITWKNGNVSDNILRAIHVFDLLSARHYVEAEDEIAFIPSGLIILEKLASCCQQIEQKIREEINNLNLKSFDYSFLISSTDGTEISKFLQGINGNTRLDDLEIISHFTSEDGKRIKNLEEKVLKLKANDPQIIINDNKQKISRYKILKQKYEKIDQSLSKESVLLQMELEFSSRFISLIKKPRKEEKPCQKEGKTSHLNRR